MAPQTDVADLTALARPPLPVSGSLAWKIEHNQRINILLLARGGAGHDNPNFTDTILVLSIRPAHGRAALVSMPRFMWVDIPALVNGGVSGKLYSAFALGGERDNVSLRSRWRTATGSGDLAAATVAGVIAEPIDGWVAVGIAAFRALIDALGGIQVTVPVTLDDWTERPYAMPAEHRMGLLTHPAWLIAQSGNFDNHAIHRGRWIREKLLGGRSS